MPATPWPLDFTTTLVVAALATLFLGALLAPEALRRTTTTAFAFAVAFACTWMVPGIRGTGATALVPLGGDVVGAVFFVLVTGIGLVVARYSTRYLDGDPALPGYARALLLTLGSVGVLVLSDDLLVASLAWVATSFALQPLLTHFPERPSAVVAAHKKFLVARASEVFLATTLVLVGTSVGSFRYERIVAWVHERPTLPPAMQVAAGSLVVVVALRTAQLPFHGWLLQVMEAPTPVSALLHAGVVNVGGFVLVRTSPWLAKAPAAQAVLVVWGLTTVLVASLVRKTRVSVKVDLAWSTCAQMGFMLVECGLGAWSLAFLHIVAHSLYKAHAFLASGSAVDDYRATSLLGPRSPSSTTSVPRRGGDVGGSWTVPLVAAVVAATVNVVGQVGPGTTLAMLALLGLSPLYGPFPSAIEGARAALVRRVAAAGTLLAVGHLAAGRLIPHVPFESAFHGLDGGLVLVAFGLARAFEVLLANRPDGPLARRLYPHAFAGFHLDDALTGWVFAWWHPRKPTEPPGEHLRGTKPREVPGDDDARFRIAGPYRRCAVLLTGGHRERPPRPCLRTRRSVLAPRSLHRGQSALEDGRRAPRGGRPSHGEPRRVGLAHAEILVPRCEDVRSDSGRTPRRPRSGARAVPSPSRRSRSDSRDVPSPSRSARG